MCTGKVSEEFLFYHSKYLFKLIGTSVFTTIQMAQSSTKMRLPLSMYVLIWICIRYLPLISFLMGPHCNTAMTDVSF